jgi:hypothetical protein
LSPSRNNQRLSLALTGARSGRRWSQHPTAKLLRNESGSCLGTHPATVSAALSRACYGEERMSLSWISDRSLKLSPRVRLVADGESDALRRKLEQVDWQPQNGFLRDQIIEKAPRPSGRPSRAA